jgi:hypothetical protein
MKLANGTSANADIQIPNEITVPVSRLQCLQKYAASIVKQQPSRIGGTILYVVSMIHSYSYSIW